MYNIIAAIAVVAGLLFYHTAAVKTSYTKGKNEVTAQWKSDIDTRKTLAEAKIKQLQAEKNALEASYKGTVNAYEAQLAQVQIDYDLRGRTIKRLRNDIANAVLYNRGQPLKADATCSAHERRLTEVSGFVGEGAELLNETGKRIAELDAKIKALQDALNSASN